MMLGGLTDVQLTEQLQPGVSLRGGGPRVPVPPIQPKHRLLHVPLRLHAVPAVIVQPRRGAHAKLHRTVAHVEGEGYHRRSWETDRERVMPLKLFGKR